MTLPTVIPNLIGICGPKDSGKSTLARLLSLQGFKHFPFAESMKNMLASLLRAQGLSSSTINRMLYGDLKEVPTPYLGGKTPRFCLQTLGTEWGRDLIHPDLWVNAWKRRIRPSQYTKIVADDVRLVNEAEAIKHFRGIIIAITRPGYDAGTHLTEREFSRIIPDLTLANDCHPANLINRFNDAFPDSPPAPIHYCDGPC